MLLFSVWGFCGVEHVSQEHVPYPIENCTFSIQTVYSHSMHAANVVTWMLDLANFRRLPDTAHQSMVLPICCHLYKYKMHLIRPKYPISFLNLLNGRDLKPLALQNLWIIVLAAIQVCVQMAVKCRWIKCCLYFSHYTSILEFWRNTWQPGSNVVSFCPNGKVVDLKVRD